ncbi:MAG: asparagine synthase (glutamine-hydrolyzing) [Candidatus Tectomicrobia bacterium]|nr:asparagine synthase (glutamine-hydrolyzing) [Candidatus Tectomicrobia bacterium]
MCGVVGVYSSGAKGWGSAADAMLDSISHRGPDDRGVAHFPRITLGHVRLAIIDIEHARQPMHSLDGRYTLVFNGEIYNYLELRQLLTGRGYRFRTYSDTEVLLNSFCEYSEKCLELLNGMFAFAVYDTEEDTLFLARDHLGVKPLYYFQSGDLFLFASEIKALLAHPAVEPGIDKDSLYEYLAFQMVLNENTFFKGIRKVEPATFLVVRDGRIVRRHEYWKLCYQIDESRNEDEFADELLMLLGNSVSLQTRSDVPVGAYLSGGLDSSIVATLAARSCTGEFQTFTGGFREFEGYDETKYAEIVNAAIGSKQYTVFPSPQDFIDTMETIIYHMDEPAGGPGVFPQYMVSKLAAEHVKVVLGGQGGDEVFGGYVRYLIAYLEQCLKGAIFETQEEGRHVVTLQSLIANLPLLRNYIPLLQSQFSSGLFGEMDERYFQLIVRSPHYPVMYDREFLQEMDSERIFDAFRRLFHRPETTAYINKMTHFDLKTLLPTLLHVEDRVSMAVSIESRVPLLDRRIVDLAASIPPIMKFSGGHLKHILVRTVRNILPKEILQRKDKMGFPVPLNEWLKGPLKEFVLDIFRSERARGRGIYNCEGIERQLAECGQFNRDLWGVLNIELWARTFIDAVH